MTAQFCHPLILHGAVQRISDLGNNRGVVAIATDDTAAAKVANEDKIRNVALLALIHS